MPARVSISDVYPVSTTSRNDRNRYCVRSMHEDDIDSVLALEQNTWGSEAWAPMEFFRALEDPLYNCWILESTPTDYAVLGYGLQHSNGDISQIANLCLHPDLRGRGLGGALLRHMIDHARANNASKVELQVDTLNERACTLYARHGFEIVDYLPHYYSNYSHAYRMMLQF